MALVKEWPTSSWHLQIAWNGRLDGMWNGQGPIVHHRSQLAKCIHLKTEAKAFVTAIKWPLEYNAQSLDSMSI